MIRAHVGARDADSPLIVRLALTGRIGASFSLDVISERERFYSMATKDEEQLQNEVLKEAIAGTEQEIFSEATGVNPDHSDDTGDRSVEEMGTGLEGQHENDADGEETEVEAKTEGEEGEEAEDAEGEDGKEGEEPTRDPKTGKFKAKSKDGEEAEGADSEAEGQQSEESQERTQGKQERIPLKTHIEERKARQSAETERDQLKEQLEARENAHKSEIQALNQRLDSIMVAISQGKPVNNGQVQGDQTGEPSLAELLIESPDKYHEKVVADVTETVQKQWVGRNIASAVEDDKDGKFVEAYNAFIDPARKSDPQHVALVRQVYQSGNPAGRIAKWYAGEKDRQALSKETLEERDERIRREFLEKLDSDPEVRKKYRPSKGQQREQQAEEGQQEAQQQGGAKHVVKLPKSLNGASGGQSGGGASAFNSGGRDKDIFDDVMSGR